LTETHRRISAAYGPVSANNALKFYRRILNYANAAYNTKIEWPTEKLRVLGLWSKEKPREGRVSFGDLPAVWAAAEKMPDPWGRLLKFYLLTGLRNTEPFKGGVDGDDFVIADTKNNTTHRLPLTGAMRDLYGNGFGVRNGRHVTEHLEELTGLHLTPHDLRRSFAAIANHAGVPDYTISMLMNHKKTDITGRYVGRNRNSMELALLTIEESISEMIEAPVEAVFEADDKSLEARLSRIREARDRARKRGAKEKL
jgi:integrase